jgi:hypothetical protein
MPEVWQKTKEAILMHKCIVDAIMLALKQDGRRGLTFLVIKPSKVNGKLPKGFWGLKVTARKGFVYSLPQVERVGMAIGRYYGEGLNVTTTMHTILFS